MTHRKARRPLKPGQVDRQSWLWRAAVGLVGIVLSKVVVALLVPMVMDTELVNAGEDMISGCSEAPAPDGEGAR
ncbi:hypothetical protein [Micromonospora chersina]|uniref:hypothetical protein n=1 Tax=Micromonospora chersina TaxID=47854 RepID=UPI0033DB0F18